MSVCLNKVFFIGHVALQQQKFIANVEDVSGPAS